MQHPAKPSSESPQAAQFIGSHVASQIVHSYLRRLDVNRFPLACTAQGQGAPIGNFVVEAALAKCCWLVPASQNDDIDYTST